MGTLTITYDINNEPEILRIVRILGAVSIKLRLSEDLENLKVVAEISGPKIPERKNETLIVVHKSFETDYK